MMKKAITITLMMILSFSLCACKKTEEEFITNETGDKAGAVNQETVAEEARESSNITSINWEALQQGVAEEARELPKNTSKKEKGISVKKGEEHPFGNKNFIYRKWKKGVMQISRKTGKRKIYKNKKLWELAYVTEDMLYYKSGGVKRMILYGVPIVKKSGSSIETTKLDFKNRKVILKERGWIEEVYVASDYILYHFRDDNSTLGDEEAEYTIKYTKKTGKKKYFKMQSITYDISYVKDDRFIFGCDNLDGYYCLDLHTNKMTHFAKKYYDITAKDLNAHAGFGEKFFYAADETKIMVYDMKNKKNQLYVSDKKIEKMCKKHAKNVKKGTYICYWLTDMFCYEGKLYIQVQLDWKKDKKYHMNYVMFSLDLKKGKKLSYEKEISKVLQKNSDDSTAWKYVYNPGKLLTIVDDMAILSFNDSRLKSGEQQIATYNMKTKKLKKVTSKYSGGYMVGYYLPYSDSLDPYYLVDEYMRYMPDYFE